MIASLTRRLLTRYLALYRVRRGAQTFIFMVMENVLDKGIAMHEVYDLKGSTVDRKCETRKPTGSVRTSGIRKDLDLRRRLRMDTAVRAVVHSQMSVDVSFLQEKGLMDYSMLLGVHVCDAACTHDCSVCKLLLLLLFEEGGGRGGGLTSLCFCFAIDGDICMNRFARLSIADTLVCHAY